MRGHGEHQLFKALPRQRRHVSATHVGEEVGGDLDAVVTMRFSACDSVVKATPIVMRRDAATEVIVFGKSKVQPRPVATEHDRCESRCLTPKFVWEGTVNLDRSPIELVIELRSDGLVHSQGRRGTVRDGACVDLFVGDGLAFCVCADICIRAL